MWHTRLRSATITRIVQTHSIEIGTSKRTDAAYSPTSVSDITEITSEEKTEWDSGHQLANLKVELSCLCLIGSHQRLENPYSIDTPLSNLNDYKSLITLDLNIYPCPSHTSQSEQFQTQNTFHRFL